MQVKWLIDGEGPNPDYAPPDPAKDQVAYQLYCVRNSSTVRIPAGTIEGVGAKIGNADCWHLCFPDNSGDIKRNIPGLIYCEPADDECREVFDFHIRAMGTEKRRWFDLARKRTDVVRKEQVAKAAADKKAGIPPMPLHPYLVEEPKPVVLES